MAHATTPPAPSPAHNPGPFRVDARDTRVNVRNVLDAGGRIVASVWEYVRGPHGPEGGPNARLFAMAPQLLERCRMSLADAEEAAKDPGAAASYNWESIAEDLRETIALAEGGTSPAEGDLFARRVAAAADACTGVATESLTRGLLRSLLDAAEAAFGEFETMRRAGAFGKDAADGGVAHSNAPAAWHQLRSALTAAGHLPEIDPGAQCR